MDVEADMSFGIIPLQKRKGVWMVLLVHHISGHWSFPKGHPEVGEDRKTTASRELKEETGLTVKSFFPMEPIDELYVFHHAGRRIEKTVQYFVAQVEGKEYPQLDELFGCDWFSFEAAHERLTFPNTQKILDNVKQWMEIHNEDTHS